jgi:hypothetical protein
LAKFKGSISRSIAYGAISTGRASSRVNAIINRKISRRNARGGKPRAATGPRGAHFNIVASTTANERKQKSTGRRTGKMWTRTVNTRFWQRTTERALANAQGEVGASLRNAYDVAIQREINRLQRKYV